MGSISINFGDVEGSFENIPAGRYPVVVEKVEVRESKSSDNNYFNWEMTITDGEHEGRKLWMITSLSPKALFRLKDVLVNIGAIEGEEEMELEWDDDVQITPKEGPLVIFPELSGAAATALVSIDTYEGKERNKVDDLLPPEDATANKKPGASRASGNGSSAKTGTTRRALR